jgi:hypothetical protein
MTPEERLEWQSELDSAMSELDARLSNPPRRGSDVPTEPVPTEPGQVNIPSEMLDEIVWRVAEQMRRTQAAGAAPSVSVAAPLPAGESPVPPAMPAGISLVIRVRWPLFNWKFWRRRSRRQALITYSDYRIT